jgi:hypothetical protein
VSETSSAPLTKNFVNHQHLSKERLTNVTKILNYDFYGMTIVNLGNREYAVGTDEEANAATYGYINDSVWSFNPDFIASHAIIDDIEVIKLIQSKCEDANPTLHKLIPDFDKFFSDAVGADGRGHFLSSYDGNESTLDEIDDDDAQEIAEVLEIDTEEFSSYYVYRLN